MIDLYPRCAGGIFDRLDADWAALCADVSVRAAVSGWLAADHLDAGVAAATGSWVSALGPELLLAALRPGGGALSDALADAVLRALLERAAGRGPVAALAARIVVQAMVPAAVRMTRSQALPFGGRTFDDVAVLVVSALYERACSGRIHPRPGRPAANLLLDALKQVCRELAADREERGEDLALGEYVADVGPGPAGLARQRDVLAAAAAAGLDPVPGSEQEAAGARLELLELLLEALEGGTISPADARAVAWHYTTTPLPDAAAAARAGTTAGAWQRRRSRAVHALKNRPRPATNA
ncbi:hypothetical protein P3T36_007289 [Kitasatospora sp. MAP12-15]|uniref:hypothetical protein n=1 Tax=unclassified Kitasatospora TaxID=2633591 RepID=UPI0024757D2D|nr:hypothetical protein [Kitasatospora sp. MAP12-44]MDH6115672.1 hypothetical protein [Kitasatospora sp. MAP12-44]